MANWINSKLNELGWSQREMARKAGLSHAIISKVISGQVNPTRDFCAAIAGALGERPEKVFRIAGLLPPVEGPLDLDADEGELIRLYRAMTPDNRDSLLVVAEQFSSRRVLKK